MVFLSLIDDVEIEAVYADSSVVLSIKNHFTVSTFLSDKDMIKFLLDPYEQGGCDLKIFLGDNKLIIARAVYATSLPVPTRRDFLSSLRTYIIPVDENCLSAAYEEWGVLCSGVHEHFAPAAVRLKDLPRGRDLLARGKEAAPTSLYGFEL